MSLPWQIVEPLDARTFAEVRHAAIFECCKWDPQVEDVCALSPLPLVLYADAWQELVGMAEQLARETMAAETAILQNPRWLKKLGLPWTLRRRFADPEILAGHHRHAHLIRFDFHFTTAGWRISEANSDVPGGFNEASGFTRLMARHYGTLAPSGDPTAAIATAIGQAMGKRGTVALAHATSFADDRQVMVYLARRLQAQGHKTMLLAPDHLRWKSGHAMVAADWAREPVDFVFRFFPADWLPTLPRRCGWWHLLGGAVTPLCNPASTIISQSKRFPLVWDDLPFPLPGWAALLPRTYDAREALRQGPAAENLVFKPAFGRVGDMIRLPGVTPEKDLVKINRSIRRYPGLWIAQERFEAVPLASSLGEVFPCVGVYTLNGSVIGAYGRLARRPLINHLAQDCAVLIASRVEAGLKDRDLSNDTIRTLQTVGA